jgi:CBS domain-containing protein
MSSSTPITPSLIAGLRAELMRFAPFSQMQPAHVDRFIAASSQCCYGPGEVVLEPAQGVVAQLLFIRRGAVRVRHDVTVEPSAYEHEHEHEHEAGELFPIGAALASRAVSATYRADADTICLALPLPAVQALARESAPFAEFLEHRVQHDQELSRRALRMVYGTQSLAEQSLETPLGDLLRRAAVSVAPATALAQALAAMHEEGVGAVLVADADSGAAIGILTRHDVLGRVTLPRLALSTPIADVMSAPVHALGARQTAQDAALAMSSHGIRHIVVTEANGGGRAVGVVSERDLFALQRLSLKQVGAAIRNAPDVDALRALAPDIRRFARNLLGQGVRARQITELISHLNDLLTERLVAIVAARRGVDLARLGWLAFGSEGRSEQTIATDQDNGIVFASDDAARDRPALLAFAREVNEALDACGYPLCQGNVMASNPECCLTCAEWLQRFERWIEHGAPEDLLKASTFFDLRALAGEQTLARPLHALLVSERARTPRFLRQLSDTALRNRAPLNWRGAVETRPLQGHDTLDLKRLGSAIFVDAARLFALAHGVAATNTRERLAGVGHALGLDPRESETWLDAFEFIQLLRLRVQLDRGARGALDGDHPNLIAVDALNDIDRRMLTEALRVARSLQQRIELDYQR